MKIDFVLGGEMKMEQAIVIPSVAFVWYALHAERAEQVASMLAVPIATRYVMDVSN
jgi:hypothetical protein